MTDEMKLLRAFIEAQGFDVEATETVRELINPMDIYMTNSLDTYDYKVTKRTDTALSLLREIVDGDTDYTNGYNLGVDLFNRIKDLVNE